MIKYFLKKWLKSRFFLKVGKRLAFLLLFYQYNVVAQSSIMISQTAYDKLNQQNDYQIPDTTSQQQYQSKTTLSETFFYWFIPINRNTFIRPGVLVAFNKFRGNSNIQNSGYISYNSKGSNTIYRTALSLDYGLNYFHSSKLTIYYGIGSIFKYTFKNTNIGKAYIINNQNQNIETTAKTVSSSGWGANIYVLGGIKYYYKNIFIGTELKFGAEVLHIHHNYQITSIEEKNITTNTTEIYNLSTHNYTYPKSFLSYFTFPFLNIGYTFNKGKNEN
jgi:hypothetical protein